MSTGCKDIAGLMDAAYAIMVLRDTLERWLHGLPTEDVILGGVPVPTLRKLVATIDERESRAAEEAIDDGIRSVVVLKNRVAALADAVDDQVTTLKGITPTAAPLAENAAPTAAWDAVTGILALGIPAGKTGATGPAGPPGTAPVIDSIDCGGAYSQPLTILDGGHAAGTED